MLHAFESPTAYFLVFEIMRGGELFDRLVKKDNYTEREAMQTVSPLIDAIRLLHSHHIVHRDIKPENLLYKDESEHSVLKLADFGMAKLCRDGEMVSSGSGTHGYVAPEVLMQQSYGISCDIWSLGVVLYLILCGEHPFDTENSEASIDKTLHGTLDFSSPLWQKVSSLGSP